MPSPAALHCQILDDFLCELPLFTIRDYRGSFAAGNLEDSAECKSDGKSVLTRSYKTQHRRPAKQTTLHQCAYRCCLSGNNIPPIFTAGPERTVSWPTDDAPEPAEPPLHQFLTTKTRPVLSGRRLCPR